MNIITGKNGSGKTTLLEIISLLSTGRSFRTPYLTHLIAEGSSYFSVEAQFERYGVDQALSFRFDGKNRFILHNETPLTNASRLLGLFPSVFYCPKDHELIAGSPAHRRRFLNIQLAQIDPLYVHHLMRYHQALKQRNVLLKTKQTESLESWETIMSLSASYLMKKRLHIIESLQPDMQAYAQKIANQIDPCTLRYSPSIVFKSPLDNLCPLIASTYQAQRLLEQKMRTTLFGPHRDDLSIIYHQKDAKMYASEGEKRTCIAGLKMAECACLSRNIGQQPLMHIDDFGTHLDEERQKRLYRELLDLDQVFITLPEKPNHMPYAHLIDVETYQ